MANSKRLKETAGAAVRFDNVQKSYDGSTLVVKNLNLEIADGEFLTMLGPSGSGKTTCLMMLAGFELTSAGAIYVEGQRVDNVPPHRRGIGMVFQNYALFPHMTVAENLAFPLSVRGLDKSEIAERVNRALEMVELAGFGSRRPLQLSGGQQQRVAVARALIFEPSLVLMDEPLGALDKQLREQMQLEIKHIHGRLGVTVVYVTHDQTEALTMSDRVAVFKDGEIRQLSTPADLYEKPCSAFVAQFIGESNRLVGTVKEIRGQFCTVELDDGSIVHAKRINPTTEGVKTTLSLRPERIVLTAKEARRSENTFTAHVEELIYHGDHLRARVTVCGHKDFVVKVPNKQSAYPISAGQNIEIGWAAEDCRALDA